MSNSTIKNPYAVSPPRYSVSHQMVIPPSSYLISVLQNRVLCANCGPVLNIFATIGASLQR